MSLLGRIALAAAAAGIAGGAAAAPLQAGAPAVIPSSFWREASRGPVRSMLWEASEPVRFSGEVPGSGELAAAVCLREAGLRCVAPGALLSAGPAGTAIALKATLSVQGRTLALGAVRGGQGSALVPGLGLVPLWGRFPGQARAVSGTATVGLACPQGACRLPPGLHRVPGVVLVFLRLGASSTQEAGRVPLLASAAGSVRTHCEILSADGTQIDFGRIVLPGNPATAPLATASSRFSAACWRSAPSQMHLRLEAVRPLAGSARVALFDGPAGALLGLRYAVGEAPLAACTDAASRPYWTGRDPAGQVDAPLPGGQGLALRRGTATIQWAVCARRVPGLALATPVPMHARIRYRLWAD